MLKPAIFFSMSSNNLRASSMALMVCWATPKKILLRRSSTINSTFSVVMVSFLTSLCRYLAITLSTQGKVSMRTSLSIGSPWICCITPSSTSSISAHCLYMAPYWRLSRQSRMKMCASLVRAPLSMILASSSLKSTITRSFTFRSLS